MITARIENRWDTFERRRYQTLERSGDPALNGTIMAIAGQGDMAAQVKINLGFLNLRRAKLKLEPIVIKKGKR